MLVLDNLSTPPPLWPPTPLAPTASHCAHAPRKTEVCCVVKASTHGISVVQLDSPIESVCVTTAVLKLRALLITAKWDWEESNTADNLQRMHPPCFCSEPMCCCGVFCWDCDSVARALLLNAFRQIVYKTRIWRIAFSQDYRCSIDGTMFRRYECASSGALYFSDIWCSTMTAGLRTYYSQQMHISTVEHDRPSPKYTNKTTT